MSQQVFSQQEVIAFSSLYLFLLIAGEIALSKLMTRGVLKPITRVDELDISKEFKVYYNLLTTGFTLWGNAAYFFILWWSVFFFGGYKFESIVFMLFNVLVILWVIYKARTSKENTDRVLIAVGPNGIQLPGYDFFTWEMINRVKITTIHLSRGGGDIDNLSIFIKDSDAENGEKEIKVDLNGSRYNPKYLESAINRYRAKLLRDAFMKG